ncbi:hypothetical protein RRG08_012516 [Elysia crispata]|uniref:Uncharacterized protein n=1 Tax=Elysia crispata TaxID=231223 RepID=A0AAE1ANY3_9GAST|nr:hypothetical protein RRG08_012516 [Elysia crispata]
MIDVTCSRRFTIYHETHSTINAHKRPDLQPGLIICLLESSGIKKKIPGRIFRNHSLKRSEKISLHTFQARFSLFLETDHSTDPTPRYI